jgi:uncharacterized protein YegJ (DUF2314 family)
MMVLLKRGFGLVAILVGLGLVAAGVGQRWIRPDGRVQIGPLIGGVILGGTFVTFGRRWMLNLVSLDVLPVEPGSPEVAEATRRAQSELPRFWDYLEQNRYECYIKFAMQTSSGAVEHIWAVVHARCDNGVVVSLANQAVERPRAEAARRVVPVNEIEDWQVVISESEIRGGYSVHALRKIALSRGYGISFADRRRLRAFVDLEAA